jgi:hypothetical protein
MYTVVTVHNTTGRWSSKKVLISSDWGAIKPVPFSLCIHLRPPPPSRLLPQSPPRPPLSSSRALGYPSPFAPPAMPPGTRKRRREPSPAAAAGERKLLLGEVVEVSAVEIQYPSYRRSVSALRLRGWVAGAGRSYRLSWFPCSLVWLALVDQSRDQTDSW